MSSSIMSNKDDSVTLESGATKVTISAATWKEANDAAHLLSSLLDSRAELRAVTQRIRYLQDNLRRLSTSLNTVEADLARCVL